MSRNAAQPGVAADELLAVARTSQLNANVVGVMRLRALVNWRMFVGCLAVSFLLAWVVHWLFELNFWASWGVIMFAWIAVGISTFFDDDAKIANSNEKPKDTTSIVTR